MNCPLRVVEIRSGGEEEEDTTEEASAAAAEGQVWLLTQFSSYICFPINGARYFVF